MPRYPFSDDRRFCPPRSPERKAGSTASPRWTAYRCGAVAIAILLGACATREQAEDLFQRQNRIHAALIYTIGAVEPSDPELADRLYKHEEELAAACEPLQTAAQRRLASQEIGTDLRWAIAEALEDCARKTDQAERVIRRVDPEAARYFLDTLGPGL